MYRQHDFRWVRLAGLILLLVLLAVVLLLVLPRIWPVLQVFIIAGLISLPLNALVKWQVGRGIPRWAATVDIVLLLILLVSFAIYFLAPVVIEQGQQFINSVPTLWGQLTFHLGRLLRRFPQMQHTLDLNNLVANFLLQTSGWLSTAQAIFASTVNLVTAFILAVVIILYTLLNPWPLLYGPRGLFPQRWWPTLDRLAGAIAEKIQRWVLGTLVLAVIVGVLDYLSLLLINIFYPQDIPFIFLFAIIGGLLEIVPVVGPIIAGIFPTLVGLSIDPVLGLLALGAFTLVQQLENQLIVPLVMQRAVRLHPVSLLFSLAILSALFGFFGAIIAVPVATVIKVLYDDWYYPMMHDGHPPEPPPHEVLGALSAEEDEPPDEGREVKTE